MNNNDYRNKLLKLSNFKKYKYILKIKSDKVKYSLLNIFDSDDYKIKVIVSFGDKKFLIKGLEHLYSDYSRSLVLIGLKNDNLKYELLYFVKNSKFKINVIDSINDISIKVESMKLLSNDNERLEIISKIEDDNNKKDLILSLEGDISKVIVLSSIKNNKIQTFELYKINNYPDILMNLFRDGLFNYLCQFNAQILASVFDTKQINILEQYNEIKMDEIKNIYSNYVINNYNKINLNNLDILTEIIIRLYTSNSYELQSYNYLIIDKIITSNFSIQDFDIIENIFIQKNIPYIVRIYNLFIFLYFDKNKTILEIDNITYNKNNLFNVLADIVFTSNKRHILDFVDFISEGEELLLDINNKVKFSNHLSEDEKTLFGEYSNFIKQFLSDNNIDVGCGRGDKLINMLFPNDDFNTVDSFKNYYISKIEDVDKVNRNSSNNLKDTLEQNSNIGVLNFDCFRLFLLYGNGFKFNNFDLYNSYTTISNLKSGAELLDNFYKYCCENHDSDAVGIIFNNNPKKLKIHNNLIIDGFSSSFINCIIVNNNFDEVCLLVARNGIYIPVINGRGEVVFTPKDYDNLRYKMMGSSYLYENKYTFSNNLISSDVESFINLISYNKENIVKQKEYIYSVFEEILIPFGLKVNHFLSRDLSNTVVDIIETGSTSRGTSISDKLDFDFVISCGKNIIFDEFKLNKIRNKILEKFRISNKSYVKQYGDLRLKDAYLYDNIYADIDVTFIMKTDNILYSADMYVEDVLNTIYCIDNIKYDYVIANILLAKKILKENDVYKSKLAENPEWGLGGIGVECWILQNGGSFIDAINSFLEYSKNINFYDFQNNYYIWCFGESFLADRNINYKNEDFLYQNFIKRNMGEMGYYKMIDALNEYKYKKNGDTSV